MYAKPRFLPGGDAAIFMEFGNAISPEIGGKVRAISAAIERARLPGVTEIAPTYRSVLVHFNPLEITFEELKTSLEMLERSTQQAVTQDAFVTRIPVFYGGDFGPDLDYVAGYHKITPEEVVKFHTSGLYPIYMLGFMPGFAYLGGVSEKIATPRLTTPRTRVPAGSVGIAGTQTGVYPADSPGGWQIIGRTPVKLFDPGREPPSLLKAGNCLSFFSVTMEEFNRIAEEVKQGINKLIETNLKNEK
jgi:KipI family sensor histidine kinase inhibitor